MASTNISIKQEAYDYLKSIKTEEDSFSDAILKLKDDRKRDKRLAVQLAQDYQKPTKQHIKDREETIKQFRKDFQRRTR